MRNIEIKRQYPVYRALKYLLVLVAVVAPLALTWAQAVDQGPWLQTGTPTSIIVKWDTTSSTDSRVRYGTEVNNLSSTANVSGSRTRHEVSLSGLQPDTRYFYSVGNAAGALEGGTDDYSFVTSPPLGTPKPTRFWVLGDPGDTNGSTRVRDAFFNFSGTQDPDLWLMLGDNAYNNGTESEYKDAVFDIFPTVLRKSVLWSAIGNHDARTVDAYTRIFSFPTAGEAGGVASGSELYYSFDYGNIHFVCLDSQISNRSASGAMMTWLENDLLATTQPWIIAFWHHPPYSNGSHDSNSEGRLIDMREIANPILEAGGVDLVMSGHSHAYERSFLLDGHYGNSGSLTPDMVLDGGNGRPAGDGAYQKPAGPTANDGAVYVVAGSSGRVSGVGSFPAMSVSLSTLGSLVVDVDGDRLDATFLDANANVRDTFTIEKGPQGPNFSVSCNASSLTLGQGGTTTSECTVAALNGYSGSVDLSCQGNPAGISCDFSPSTISPTGTSTLTLSAGSTQAAGSFAFDVQGSDGLLTNTATLDTTVTVVTDCSLYSATFESGTDGWTNGADTCSTGAFIVGTPEATAWQVAGGNPGQAYFTASNPSGADGSNDVDGGVCEALSPVVSCAGQSEVDVSLDYFHGQRDAGDDPEDGLTIEVLNDGVVVDTIVSIGDVLTNPEWTSVLTTVSNPGDIQIRVRASDSAASGAGDIVEAGIDNVVIQPTVFNGLPSVVIASPAGPSSANQGDAVTFSGSANDIEDGDLSTGLSWSSSLDGVIGSGASFSTTSLSVGSHVITAFVSDSGGANGSSTVSVNVQAPNNDAPVVAIASPANPTTVTPGTAVTFTGSASDTEDGSLSANLSWSSDLDGVIGSGASFETASLSVGAHMITASVTDSGGAGDTDNVTVTVDGVGGQQFDISVQVATGSDDAEERASSGSVGLTSSDLELVDESGSREQLVGVRFPNAGIPQGATIVSASVQFTVDSTNSGTANLTINGELSTNSATFTTNNGNISSRNRTSASASWSPPVWSNVGQSGPAQETTSLVSIVQELVDQSNWSAVSAVTIIITGDGEREAESFNGSAGSAPRLNVSYATFAGPANAAPSVVIASPSDSTSVDQGDSVTFSGTASDAEDGSLSANLSWSSNLDGVIGAGDSFSISSLSAGTHTVVASVIDSGGASGSSAVNITVVDPNPPACAAEVDFESGAAGWTNSGSSTCSTGSFIIGTPDEVVSGGVTTQLSGDKTSGSGGNAFFTADNAGGTGINDVDRGTCIATSPIYPVSTDSDVALFYYHGQRDAGDDASGDFFRLEMSTDGGVSFSILASHGDETVDASWTEVNTEVAAGTNVQFRVQASDGPSAGDLVEAGIDELSICTQ